LSADRNAVEQLFTYKTTTTNSDGETVTATAGVGVRIDDLLKSLTDTDGAVQGQIDNVGRLLELNKQQIERIDLKLAAKRELLQNQFNAMEKALASLQAQGSSLTNFASQAAAQGGAR